MEQKKDQQPHKNDRPQIQYRQELEKVIEINKSHHERRNRAASLRIISYGLFGRNRYKNIYLKCYLSSFYYALLIANTAHQRVENLAMIVRFQDNDVCEYYSKPFNGQNKGIKKNSKIVILLTREPTKINEAQPGFNPGIEKGKIQNPITEILGFKKNRNQKRQERGKRHNQNQNKPKREHQNQKKGKGRQEEKHQKKKYQHRDQQQSYERGAQKTRGYSQKNTHNDRRQYKKENQDRGDRRPRNQNRYEDDD